MNCIHSWVIHGLFLINFKEPMVIPSLPHNTHINSLQTHRQETAVERISLLVDYETGYGGAVYPVYNPYVFFRNGTVVKEPKIAIEDMDLQARSSDAGRWGSWKRTGSKVLITWDKPGRNGKIQTSEKDWPGHEAYPASDNEKLNGSWGSVGGGGNLALGGSIGILAAKNFHFTSDGHFTTGSLAAISAPGQVGRSRKTDSGTYNLSGHTLTLRFDNGETRKLFFCFMSKDKTKSIRIGGSNYTPNKSPKH